MVRLAPTPSGYLHRGNAANFAANALLAYDGEILLRIDDIDRGRYRRAYVEHIFEVIHWLGILPTRGPAATDDFEQHWSQADRMKRHGIPEDLLDHPLVFPCPCSRRELAGGEHAHGCLDPKNRAQLAAKRSVAWRVNTRKLPAAVFIPDLVGTGFEQPLHEAIPYFVLVTKAGHHSYQLACTIDDLEFGIDRCARGRDLLASTAAQHVVSNLLGYPPLFERIEFLHHPLLPAVDGSKLSKSAGAEAVARFPGDGIGPEEIFEIARGWLRP